MGRSPYSITEPDKPHFMTCTVVEWLPIFTRPETVKILLDCWRYQSEHAGLRLYGYVGYIERLRFAKRAHKTDREYHFWQEGVHPELVFSKAMMREKLNYIHANLVKRGYVRLPEHWRYSSASNYMGLAGLIDIDPW